MQREIEPRPDDVCLPRQQRGNDVAPQRGQGAGRGELQRGQQQVPVRQAVHGRPHIHSRLPGSLLGVRQALVGPQASMCLERQEITYRLRMPWEDTNALTMRYQMSDQNSFRNSICL